MRVLPPLLLAAVLGACGLPNHRHDLRVHEAIPYAGGTLSDALYQSTGVPLRPGNRVELINNGHIFDVLEEEILAARRSLHVVIYIWQPGGPSDRLLRALARRAPGVACRVLVDPLQSQRFDEVAYRLTTMGCEARLTRPIEMALGSLDTARLRARNHRKLVIRDGVSGVTGGFGIWKSWLGDGRTPEHWRDTGVRVRGPAVREMQLAFAQNWQEAGGRLLPATEFPEVPPGGGARAGFVASTGAATLTLAERMTALTVAAARRRLWIANSYFIPSTALQDMLITKARQGVDVRVLCPGRAMDVAPVRAAQRATYARLLEGGVRIWEYEVSMMHAKTMLVDDTVSVIGSTNLDPISMRAADEGSLVVEDAGLARALEESFQRDLRHSREILRDGWRRRGLLERLEDWWPALVGRHL